LPAQGGLRVLVAEISISDSTPAALSLEIESRWFAVPSQLLSGKDVDSSRKEMLGLSSKNS